MATETSQNQAGKAADAKGAQTPFGIGPDGMTPDMSTMTPEQISEFAMNMASFMEKGHAVWTKMLAAQADERKPPHLDPFNAAPAFSELWQSFMSDPGALADATTKFWNDQAEIWRRSSMRSFGAEVEPVVSPDRGDKRFKAPEWSENAVFDAIKQSYLLTAGFLSDTAHTMGDLDPRDRKKVDFLTRLFVEAISPSNFFATNPEVLKATADERGANLVRGLDHMLDDLERGKGQLLIRQTDLEKFKVGENMAVTPGQIIYRNELFELIQYEPTTPNVEARPLLICPPWINKYYILDLNQKKSLVKWMVDQGQTVFVMSWINPDERHGEIEFVDYIAKGLFEAIYRVLEETQAPDVHLASYCIGGTMTGTALAYLAQTPEHPLAGKIASCTFLTTQLEFSDAGELQTFIDEEQLHLLNEDLVGGTLGAEKMAAAFNMLRSSDLIWGFVINNYMLGKEPFPFDLLYWNSDSTRMPGRVHKYYLETFYKEDMLARGELNLGGQQLDLSKINVPTYHVTTKEDHIAPPDSCYRGLKLMGGDRKLVLAGSGHIAGVVNPPAGGKYQYWTRADGALPDSIEAWRDGAVETPGSWWGDWDGWLKGLNTADPVSARKPGRRHNALCDAPGEYVRVRYDAPAPTYSDEES